MIVFDGPVLPDDLTTFVREVPVPFGLFLNTLLPDVTSQSNRIDVGIITRTNRTARFRSYDGNIHRTSRDNAQMSTIELPPLSDSLSMGELERLRLEYARTGGTNQGAFVDAIYNDAEQLTRNVQNRMELARGDLLMDGKFTLLSASGEPQLEADFGVPAGNFVTAGTTWSTSATCDPLGDLNSWVTDYINVNGYPPGGMLITRSILNAMLVATSIRTTLGTLVGAPPVVTRLDLDRALDARGLPPIVGVYDTQVDVDGTAARVTDASKVVFVPPKGQPFGRTVWGVSATALELVNSSETSMSFEDAPGIVGVVEKDGPPYREYTFVDAVGMPVLDNPKALYVATVL